MTWDRIRAAKEKFEAILLGKANVVGVGIGNKIVGGKETDEPAVIVFVERKLPEAQLKRKDRVPKTVGDVKTDVVETGRLRALGAPSAPRTRTERWRPAPGGVSVGHHRVSAGTLGGVVRRGAHRFILSNNHVLANSNDARLGDSILQPGPADRGGQDDVLASLAEWVPIRFRRSSPTFLRRVADLLGLRPASRPRANFVDAALARPLREDSVEDVILGLGRTRGMAEARVGEEVRKSGRTTGVTEGRVVAGEAVVHVEYGGRVGTFADQVVAGPMSHGGDSGSFVLNRAGEVVGLLFAGSDTATVWNPARRVAEALRIEW